MILSAGAAAAAFVALVVLGLGVGASRPDIVVLAVPLLLTTVWAGLTRPDRRPEVSVAPAGGHSEIGKVRALAHVDAPAGTEAVVMRVSSQGYRSREVLTAGGRDREFGLSLPISRTGVHEMFRVDSMGQSFGGVLVTSPVRSGPVPIAVHPMLRPLREVPLPFRLTGLTGTHTSRRVGDGYDVHDVHEFGPGDRLKRIDWRVSARRALDVQSRTLGTLYARRTFATADATVMIVVDSRDDVAEDVSTWAGGVDVEMDTTSSIDLAREAAATIARVYLDGGDRVGLDDLGRRRRPVRPATGRHQWERISQRLVRVAPEGWPDKRQRAPQLPTDALVVLCSTFLDDEAARMARQWRAQGHRVIAVDTLPGVSTVYLNVFQDTAFRLVMLERRLRLRGLQRAGVELVTWRERPGAGADSELHALSRVRGAHR